MSMKAYPDSSVDLWDKNFVNGEYIIAYELNTGLDYTLQEMLPKVRFAKMGLSPSAISGKFCLHQSKNIYRQ